MAGSAHTLRWRRTAAAMSSTAWRWYNFCVILISRCTLAPNAWRASEGERETQSTARGPNGRKPDSGPPYVGTAAISAPVSSRLVLDSVPTKSPYKRSTEEEDARPEGQNVQLGLPSNYPRTPTTKRTWALLERPPK